MFGRQKTPETVLQDSRLRQFWLRAVPPLHIAGANRRLAMVHYAQEYLRQSEMLTTDTADRVKGAMTAPRTVCGESILGCAEHGGLLYAQAKSSLAVQLRAITGRIIEPHVVFDGAKIQEPTRAQVMEAFYG